jgi:hypothetical protein
MDAIAQNLGENVFFFLNFFMSEGPSSYFFYLALKGETPPQLWIWSLG